jgi:hypothetical protein
MKYETYPNFHFKKTLKKLKEKFGNMEKSSDLGGIRVGDKPLPQFKTKK